jgi:hypothetical protein
MREHPCAIDGKLLFTFAIVADTHVNPHDGRSGSPWKVNALANERAITVAKRVKQHNPAFTVHLGDMVHPIPEQPSYAAAADRFKQIFHEFKDERFYLMPGNHDVGDKPVSWMPAGVVRPSYLSLYRQHFGADFYSFDCDNCHFIVLNSPIMNSGFDEEFEQQKWLGKDLEANRGKRIFFFTHYPPYVSDRDEPSTYDNVDEPARSWLLDQVEKSGVEAMFAAHVHNFFYDRIGRCEYYIALSSAFVRQDFSELFRVGSPEEHGRNAANKLGYMLVNVYEKGHAATVYRTEGEVTTSSAVGSSCIPRPRRHPKEIAQPSLGVDLRHPWAEYVDIPYAGGVEEFYRKRVRNDYPILSFWELGTKLFRVPIQDVAAPMVRARMRALADLGCRFVAFSYDLPNRGQIEATRDAADLLSGLEIILQWSDFDRLAERLASKIERLRMPIYLSKVRTGSDEAHHGGNQFSHFINHGFRTGEKHLIEAFLQPARLREVIAGFVWSVPRSQNPLEGIMQAAAIAEKLQGAAIAQIRLTNDNPAVAEDDDFANANRVAEAVVAASAFPGVMSILDTFVDHDRGYCPRAGLVDRRYDLRAAGAAFANLTAELAQPINGIKAHEIDDGRIIAFSSSKQSYALVLPATAASRSGALGAARKLVAAVASEVELATAQSTGRKMSGPILLKTSY